MSANNTIPKPLAVGTMYESADGTKFIFTGKKFMEVKERKQAPPEEVFRISELRSVDYRFFLETSGKVRAWTTDWKITQPMLEQAPYFERWTSNTYSLSVPVMGNYHAS